MISIVTSTIRDNMWENILDNFLRQDYEPKELIIVINHLLNKGVWEQRTKKYKDIRVFQLNNGSLGECLNLGSEKAKFDMIAKFDDDDFYSASYLLNSMKLFTTTNAAVVGKSTIFVYFKKDKNLSIYRKGMENQKVIHVRKNALAGGTLLFKKEILNMVKFAPINLGEDIQFQIECLRNKIPLYSGNRYDYVMIRRPNEHLHTWQVDDLKFQSHCTKIADTDSFEKYILKEGKR
jgi:hypothetical protein